MSPKPSTADRILDSARRLFNERGYAATTQAAIAADAGIAQGNLTYHFPAKQDIADRLLADAQQRMRSRDDGHRPGRPADDYVRHVLFSMRVVWDHRFLLRDRAQMQPTRAGASPEMLDDLQRLQALLDRFHEDGLLRVGAASDRATIARSLWVLSRYWLDHLEELEGIESPGWADQLRGMEHHLAILHPCLTAEGRRQLDAALGRATELGAAS